MDYDGIVKDLKAAGFTDQGRNRYSYRNPVRDCFAAIRTVEHDRLAVYIWKRGEWAQSKITDENFHDFQTLYKSDAYETEFRVKCFDQEDVKSVIKINYTDKNGQLVHIGEHTELVFLYDGEKLKITE